MAKKKPESQQQKFGRRASDKPVTRGRVRQMYERPSSFTNMLPWMEYLPEDKVFVLEDGISVGVLLELRQVGTEARPGHFFENLRDSIQAVVTDAVPEDDDSPWIIQFFLEDIPSFRRLAIEMDEYITPRAKASDFSQDYLDTYREHLQQISLAGGLFVDEAVSGAAWQGKVRKVRCTLFRRVTDKTLRTLEEADRTPISSLNEVKSQLVTALQTAGVSAKQLEGEHFYEWMVRWFNPNPPMTEGDVDALLDSAPYPGDEEMPFGSDFSESLIFGMPQSDNKSGTWWFDDVPHKYMSIQSLRKIPSIGHISAEQKIGDKIFAVFDKLPEHSKFVMTIIVQPQDEVKNHIGLVKHGSVGDTADAVLTRSDAEDALLEIASGNKLFPVMMGVYIREETEDGIRNLTNQVSSLLISNGIQPIYESADLIPLDAYIRSLPMCYDINHDKFARRSRFVFSKHIANLLPLYGRSTGTGNHGFIFFNRGAEPLTFDPLNNDDRKKNAHMLVLGPTGAGKSAMLVYLMLQMLAVHRPRIFVIEAGNSFGLLGDYLEQEGISVNQVSLQPTSDVSLPPFADAMNLIDTSDIDLDVDSTGEDPMDTDDEDESRDILGEMEIVARIMITGGEVKEDEKMTRSDRMLVRRSIILAAETVKAAGKTQVLTEDVVAALNEIGKDTTLPAKKRERATEMADGMELFCGGLGGKFFNSPGTPWPEVDVTIMDIGILAREGYQDQLTVAYMGLMSHINNLVERYQNDERPTIVLTDEGHIITTNPLLAPYVVKITKMWRKLGAWFWIATQNLEDFPDASKRMLNMMEWWLCLVMPKEEIEQIARFKQLSEEQKSMLLSAKKEPGKFVEGVVLSDQLQALFRSVPPALALALAMTEKHEKAERAQIMEEHQCTELEAVQIVAQRIIEHRSKKS